MNRLVLFAGLISIIMGACSPATPLPPTPTLVPPTLAVPTLPPVTLTPTPVEVSLRVSAERINCRFGPGTVFETISEIQQGKILNAIGRNDAANWWYVEDPLVPGGRCWVSTEVTEALGDATQLPVIGSSLITVTNVDLRVEPNRIVVSCDQFPQTVFFEALVTTNGPTLLTWKWELSNGTVSNVGTLIYEGAGTQAINEFYQVNAPNEYWVKLVILTPNEVVEQVNFPVTCN